MSDTQEKATTRPWKYEPDGSAGMNDCCIWGPQGPGYGAVCNVASTGLIYTSEQWQEFKANANLIVRAVNNHGKLLEALKAAQLELLQTKPSEYSHDVLNLIEAAIQSGEEPGSTSAFAPNSTAHEMPERDDGHIAVTHTGCTQPYCSICEGGLFLCSQCGSTEGATTSECPGERMTEAQIDLVYAGKIDFRGGKWVEECSPHTPVAYRDRSLHLRASRDVRARWERLGLDPSTAPTVFASDVENMVEEELRRLRDTAGRAVVQYSDPAL